jgi:hypothetical protein
VVFPNAMSIKPMHRRTFASAVCLLGLGGAVVFSGCNKSEAAPSRPSSSENAPATSGAKSETDTYVVEIKATGAYKAGADSTLEVVLATKGAYHTNAQYPYKFKTASPAPAGVAFPKPVLARADGSFEEKKGTFKVPFRADKPGKYTIGGVFSLSVCSEANCIMDKVPLEIAVDVK